MRTVRLFSHEVFPLAERNEAIRNAYSSRSAARGYRDRCSEDRAYFINTACDTFNPQLRTNKSRPMLLCKRQAEMTYALEDAKIDGEDIVLPKCRKIGGSWVWCEGTVHDFLFEEGFQALLGSRKDNLVDGKGEENMDTLMSKIDYTIARLPKLLQPPGYTAKAPFRVDFLIKNPHNGAQISGEAITEHFGAAARGGVALLDELSRCQWKEKGWSACGQTVVSRQGIGTPQGKDFFWGLCYPDEYKQLYNKDSVEYPRMFMVQWKDLPWCNQFYILKTAIDEENPPWKRKHEFVTWFEDQLKIPGNVLYRGHGYSPNDDIPLGAGYDDGHGNIVDEDQRRPLARMPKGAGSVLYPWRILEGFRYDQETAAMELDVDFENSKKGRVYKVQTNFIVRQPSIKRHEEFPLYFSLDPGRGAGNAFCLGWFQWSWEELAYQWLRMIMMEDRTVDFFIPLLTGRTDHKKLAEDEGLTAEWHELWDEMQDPMWRPDKGFGDPYADAKHATGKESVSTKLRQAKLVFRPNHNHRDFDTRIKAAKKVMKYTQIDMEHCSLLYNALTNVAWPQIKDTTAVVTIPNGYVHHKVFSHPAAMFEYAACEDPHEKDTEEYAAKRRSIDRYAGREEVSKVWTPPHYAYPHGNENIGGRTDDGTGY